MDLLRTLKQMRDACPGLQCNCAVELRKSRWDAQQLVFRWRYKQKGVYAVVQQEMWLPMENNEVVCFDETLEKMLRQASIQMRRKVEKQR